MNKLHSMNVSGNLHMACHYINQWLPEFVDGIVHMECTGFNTIIVFRADEELIARARQAKRL